jgi:peptide/nickel transport system permease protein
MIGMGRDQDARHAWFVIAEPGVALLVTALGLNLLGEGLNTALDPPQQGRVKSCCCKRYFRIG